MSKNYISEVIKQFAKQRYSRQTEEKVQHWITDGEHQAEKDKKLYEFWQSLNTEADDSVHKSFQEVTNKLNIQTERKRTMRLNPLTIAAILIPLVFILGVAVYYIATPDRNLITVSVAYGERKELILPDQSVVWLNSGSSVKYPKEFTDGVRKVRLSGEAYFSVVRDTLRQFVVETGQLDVRVLGTEFNVTAYQEDSSVTASVHTGKVQAVMPRGKACVLVASQQLVYDKSNRKYRVEDLAACDVSAWRDGKLLFEKKKLTEILKVLERTYNVKIEADKALPADHKLYTIKFVHSENVEQIIGILGNMAGFEYHVEGKKIKLSKVL